MEPTLSSTVRAILQSKANQPIRVNALWDAVRATAPALAKTKTHFKTQIIGGMFRRDELVKLRVPDSPGAGVSAATPASLRLVYAVRLKGSGTVRRRLSEQGLDAGSNMGGTLR